MKTKNNIQKTALTVVAATGLVIFSFAAHAQHAMKSVFAENETSHITMAMGKTSNNLGTTAVHSRNFTVANAFAAYLAPEIEEPLQLEDWMMEENSFVTTFAIEAETERPLQVESWMTNEKTFDFNSANVEIATEETMSIEAWMVDENTFSNTEKESSVVETQKNSSTISTKPFIYHEVNTEEKLLVEEWMVNPNIWKN